MTTTTRVKSFQLSERSSRTGVTKTNRALWASNKTTEAELSSGVNIRRCVCFC